jgi:hypothetical protein
MNNPLKFSLGLGILFLILWATDRVLRHGNSFPQVIGVVTALLVFILFGFIYAHTRGLGVKKALERKTKKLEK